MPHLAFLTSPPVKPANAIDRPPGLVTAQVIDACSAGRWRVATPSGLVDVELAASCLLQPAIGDQVLVHEDIIAGSYILAILRRRNATSGTLRIAGDASLQVEGRLDIRSTQGASLSTGGQLDLAAERIGITAESGLVCIGKLDFIGRALTASADRLRAVGQGLELIAERIFSHVGESLRRVDRLDAHQSGQLDFKVDTLMTVKAETTAIRGKQLVKLDSDQIHLG